MSYLRSLALVGLLTGISQAGADELNRILERDKLAAGKLTADVQAALAQSRTLSDPLKAQELLRKAKIRLEDDFLLPERQRLGLLQQVQGRLKDVAESARIKRIQDDLKAQQAADKALRDQRKKENEPPAKSQKGAMAQNFIGGVSQALDKSQRLKYLREQGVMDVLGEIDVAAARMKEELITERFIAAKKRSQPKLDPREKEVLEALNSTISVHYDRTDFKDVINDLSRKTKQPIFIDEKGLQEAMIDYENTPVTLKGDRILVKTALRVILGNLGLTYVVQEGTIHVITVPRAREMMVTYIYPVSDFVAPDIRLMGTPMGRMQMYMNAQSLINLIQATIDPAVWQMGGSIMFEETSMSLIVRAPAEFHFMFPLGRR